MIWIWQLVSFAFGSLYSVAGVDFFLDLGVKILHLHGFGRLETLDGVLFLISRELKTKNPQK